MRSFLTRIVDSAVRAVLLIPCLLLCVSCATPFPIESLEKGMTAGFIHIDLALRVLRVVAQFPSLLQFRSQLFENFGMVTADVLLLVGVPIEIESQRLATSNLGSCRIEWTVLSRVKRLVFPAPQREGSSV